VANWSLTGFAPFRLPENRGVAGSIPALAILQKPVRSALAAEKYVEPLLEKIGEARYPSKDLMARIERVAPLLLEGSAGG
jgi:hypothetical protein